MCITKYCMCPNWCPDLQGVQGWQDKAASPASQVMHTHRDIPTLLYLALAPCPCGTRPPKADQLGLRHATQHRLPLQEPKGQPDRAASRVPQVNFSFLDQPCMGTAPKQVSMSPRTDMHFGIIPMQEPQG